MAEQINVTLREEVGTRQCRRLRRAGQIPAVLYGHGEGNVNLAVPSSELHAAIRHGSRMLQMGGALAEGALIREIQWDAFGLEVLHIDLTRVSAEEAVQITVSIELRGEAPGIKEGGIVEHNNHEVEISCPAGAIPEKLSANINDLHLGQSVTAGQLALPDGAQLVTPDDTVIVSCTEPAEVSDEEVTPGLEGVEPEVIGRKEEEGSGEES